MSANTTLDAVLTHILANIPSPRPSISRKKPVFVAVQGPQGSGKTYLCNQLRSQLSSPSYDLRVADLSIDDLYLPYEKLKLVASSGNPLLIGRGLPGTHDISLGISTLDALGKVNSGVGAAVDIPVFDKSQHGGFGDRSLASLSIQGPIDLVILEGWCVGFYPLTRSQLETRWTMEWQKELQVLGLNGLGIQLEHISFVNEELRNYINLWGMFDVFVQIAPHPEPDIPSSYSHIYTWRLEQEHHMKKHNGGRGMNDDEVKSFVDRYIPGYVFFGGGVTSGYVPDEGSGGGPPWKTRGLRVLIDAQRELRGVETF